MIFLYEKQMKSSPKIFDRRITLSRKDKFNYVILNKKEFQEMRAGIQQNRNRRKSVFIFILKEFNSDIAAEQ